jgi:predicted DCC family thiol-disulfide oxidoreductase YuxK
MNTIFYDGKCGLCSREINYYKKIVQANRFLWLDIATDPTPLKQLRISQEDGLRRLHALDEAGRLHIGVDAFILIWSELPYWRLLGMVVGLPGIRQSAQLAYNCFADYRFSRLAHCKIAADNAILK